MTQKRTLTWVNSPVLAQALIRYKEGHLARPMKLWIEQILEISHFQN